MSERGARFRPELEGLRGLAVALVVLAHAGLPIPGAALGPDIFFALSGYLIVGILMRRLEAGRGIGFGEFYARRFRRILPAITATVLLTVGVVALLGDPFLLARTAGDGIAAVLGFSNIHFGANAVDYFSGIEPSPLLPLWSIGVEEQFYLLVPLLLALAYRLARRRGAVLLLLALAVLTTALAVVWSPQEPIWSYYLLPTRGYGLALGGLLAIVERELLGSWLRRLPFAPLAVAAIAALAVITPSGPGYPGLFGPLAGLASAALIFGTAGARGGRAVGALLSLTPVRLLGRISYSLYLVHFPFYVLPPMWGIEMSLPVILLATAGALLAASLLYLLVERPFRGGRFFGERPRLVIPRAAGLLASVVLASNLIIGGTGTLASAASAPAGEPPIAIVTPTISPSPNAAPATPAPWAPTDIAGTRDFLLRGPLPADLQPALARAAADADDALASGCGLGHDGTAARSCVRGKTGGLPIAIIGDSHAAHWIPALERAGAAYGWEIHPFIKVNCGWVDTELYAERLGRVYRECTAWRANVRAALAELGPALVIVASARYPQPALSFDAAVSALGRAVKWIDAPVLLFADTPYGQTDIPSCLARHRSDVAACTVARSQTAYGFGYRRDMALARELELPVFDFTPALCPGTRCAPVIDGIVVYHDHHHLTVTMSRHLAEPLGAALAAHLAALAAAEIAASAPPPWAPIIIGGITSRQTSGPLPGDLRPTLGQAAGDDDTVRSSGCGQDRWDTHIPTCKRGTPGGTRILLIGDSHAAQWEPGLTLAARAYGWEIIPLTKSNCPFEDYVTYDDRMGRLYPECAAWREQVIARANELKPALILVGTIFAPDPAKPAEHAVAYFTAAKRRLLERFEAPVVLLSDLPFNSVDLPSCLARHRGDISACVMDQPGWTSTMARKIELATARAMGIPYLDLAATLCPAASCAPIQDGIIFRHDYNHITATMSRHLAEPLGAAIAALLAR